MKIVYMIGNGFDLAQGLKTSYSDFYEKGLLPKKFSEPILQKLQASVKSDIKSWADMEKRLGEFTTDMNGLDDVDTVYDYLKRELKNYLLDEQTHISVGADKAIQNRSILVSPQKYLLPESAEAIKDYIHSLSTASKVLDIDIISFNYTDVIERAFAYTGKPVVMEKINGDIAVKLNTVYKVHGSLDREMIMGVADERQIANKQLSADLDILDVLVKPRTTSLRRDHVCTRCERAIAQADLIVMYGLSIGETDKNWWEKVTNRLGSYPNTRLIIYSHPPVGMDPYDYPRIARHERESYKRLYEFNTDSPIRYTRLNKQIYVALSDTLFEGITEKVK